MTTPTLQELADGVMATRRRVIEHHGTHAVATLDQACTAMRNALERLGVDLDDPVAARAIIAVFEVSTEALQHARTAHGATTTEAMIKAMGHVGAAADVAAGRHATGARA